MCYSAQVHAEFKDFKRHFPDVKMDLNAYVKTFWCCLLYTSPSPRDS